MPNICKKTGFAICMRGIFLGQWQPYHFRLYYVIIQGFFYTHRLKTCALKGNSIFCFITNFQILVYIVPYINPVQTYMQKSTGRGQSHFIFYILKRYRIDDKKCIVTRLQAVGIYSYTFNFDTFNNDTFKSVIFRYFQK